MSHPATRASSGYSGKKAVRSSRTYPCEAMTWKCTESHRDTGAASASATVPRCGTRESRAPCTANAVTPAAHTSRREASSAPRASRSAAGGRAVRSRRAPRPEAEATFASIVGGLCLCG